jgi:hypothetical protein
MVDYANNLNSYANSNSNGNIGLAYAPENNNNSQINNGKINLIKINKFFRRLPK